MELRRRTHPISAEARLGCSWVAGQSTHGWVGQGSGYLLKDALSPNGGHGAAPPLSRRSRVQCVRLRSVPPRGERSRVGNQPHCPPQQQRRGSRTRGEGSWIGPLWSRPKSPRPSLESPSPAARVSAGTGGCADLFTARDRRSRGVNIAEGCARDRAWAFYRTPLSTPFCE